MCDKVSYTTHREAAEIMHNFRNKRYMKRRCKSKIPRRVYKCDDCGQYHLTSKTNDKTKW